MASPGSRLGKVSNLATVMVSNVGPLSSFLVRSCAVWVVVACVLPRVTGALVAKNGCDYPFLVSADLEEREESWVLKQGIIIMKSG